ncbi:MAG: HDOD domain-containing protein [Planctomycetota bacterium]
MSSKHIVAILRFPPNAARELARVLGSADFETIVVDTTDALFKVINYQRVDYLVVDRDLDAYVNGLEILERTYRDLLRPKSVLLANVTEDEAKKARAIGVHILLQPDVDPNVIKQAMEDLRSKTSHEQIFIHPLARQIVQGSKGITPMPQLVVKLAGYLTRPETVDLQALANDISVDPTIMGNLLRLINSAAMGMQRKFTRTFDAVNLLGVRRTISLILTSVTLKVQGAFARSMTQEDRNWYNKRTVLVASGAFAFAKHVGNVSPDTAYILGLFQEIGILLMSDAYQERYAQALQRFRQSGQVQLEAVEQAAFGVTHADVGGAMLQKWDLPPSLIGPVLSHHNPATFEEKSETERRYLHCMRVAEAAANLADGHIPHRYPLLKRLMDDFGKENAEKCKFALKESIEKAKESSKLFQIPIPSTEELGELVERMIQSSAQTGGRIDR